MLGWAVGFFIAALVAALFGFGAVASAFAGIAQILFWVFVALFALSLVMGLFTRHGPSTGVAAGGRTAALLAVVVGVAILGYVWIENDWSAEKTGRVIDRNTAELTADAAQALDSAGERAEALVENTGDQLADDAGEAANEVEDEVDGDPATE